MCVSIRAVGICANTHIPFLEQYLKAPLLKVCEFHKVAFALEADVYKFLFLPILSA